MGIGDFKKPAVKMSPDAITAAKAMSEGIQEELKDSIKTVKSQEEKLKDYKEILKEAKISVDEAQIIVDDILMKGAYEETVNITKRVSVTFKTRTQKDIIRYHNHLEARAPRYEAEVREIMARYFLAASLVRFADQKLHHVDEEKVGEDRQLEAFHSRLEWIEKQPERTIALLIDKLSAFDQKISVVMSEGVVENF